MNTLGANVTPGFSAASSPISNPTTAGSNAANALTTSYSGYTNVNSANSWQERFLVKNAFESIVGEAACFALAGGFAAGFFFAFIRHDDAPGSNTK